MVLLAHDRWCLVFTLVYLVRLQLLLSKIMLYWNYTNIFGFTVHEAVIGLIVAFMFTLGISVAIGMIIRILHDVTVRYPKFISFFNKRFF